MPVGVPPSGGDVPFVPQEFCESTMSPNNAAIAALRTGTMAESPNHFLRPVATTISRITLSQAHGGVWCVQGITPLEVAGAAVATVIVAEA